MERMAWRAASLERVARVGWEICLVCSYSLQGLGDELRCGLPSEFGMQGLPDRRTVDEWTEDKSQLYPQSKVAMNHNKAVSFTLS